MDVLEYLWEKSCGECKGAILSRFETGRPVVF